MAGILPYATLLGCAVSLGAQGQTEAPLAPGAVVRVTAPQHVPPRALGGFAGVRNDSLFVRDARTTIAMPRALITRIELQTESARTGAIRGAWRGALMGGGIGLLYASNGPESAWALLPTGALVGAGIGAWRKGKTWTSVDTDAVMGAPVVVAPIPSTPDAPLPASTSRPPLPPGFVVEQSFAGARTGAIGMGVGLVAGAALYFAALQKPGDELGALGPPLVGALLGNVIAAPIGVARFSRARGIEGSLRGAYGGAALGILGLAGGGVGFFFTVPWGSALGYNVGRR